MARLFALILAAVATALTGTALYFWRLGEPHGALLVGGLAAVFWYCTIAIYAIRQTDLAPRCPVHWLTRFDEHGECAGCRRDWSEITAEGDGHTGHYTAIPMPAGWLQGLRQRKAA